MRILIPAVFALAAAAAGWAASEPAEMASAEGEHIILKLRADDMKQLDDPEAWVAKLDRIYEAYVDLVGAAPCDGEKITILSTDEYPGGWAVAGNPILWYQPVIPDAIEQINKGDWLFGILHELGHDFDLDYRWVWDAEFFANFKMTYALEQTKGKVIMNDHFYDEHDPSAPDIDAYYHEHAVDVGTDKFLLDGGSDGDSLQDKFSQITKEIGWEPFKRTFRKLWTMDPKKLPEDPIGRRSIFLRMLENESGKPLLPRFVDWGFTVAESTTPDTDTFAKELRERDWVVSLEQLDIETAADKKVPITVEIAEPKETIFQKGLGTHANSEIIYNLDGKYAQFESYIGVTGRDNARNLWGSVIFEVVTDGKSRYKSPLMRGGTAYKHVQVDVAGVKELKLLVDEGGDGGASDHAGWADAKVIAADGEVTYLSDITPVKAVQGWDKLKLDRALDDGPMLFGHGPAARTADVVATCEDPSVPGDRKRAALERGAAAGVYTCTLDPMPKGTNRVWLTIKMQDCPLTLHEMVIVKAR